MQRRRLLQPVQMPSSLTQSIPQRIDIHSRVRRAERHDRNARIAQHIEVFGEAGAKEVGEVAGGGDDLAAGGSVAADHQPQNRE